MKKHLGKIGWALIISGIVFVIIETIYFGSNYLARTPQERLMDSLASLIINIGVLLCVLNFFFKSKKIIKELIELGKDQQGLIRSQQDYIYRLQEAAKQLEQELMREHGYAEQLEREMQNYRSI